MEDKKLEVRIYLFTIYQLSGNQKGIQCLHAALRYGRKYYFDPTFNYFMDNWETAMMMNGGTTNIRVNEEGVSVGTLNQILDKIKANDINHTFFHEPDLNDALTSVCFLVDERVFNFKDYPKFSDYVISHLNTDLPNEEIVRIRIMGVETIKEVYAKEYGDWLELIGGKQNEFLKDLLPNYRWA